MINIYYMDCSDRNIEEHHQRKIDRNNNLLFKKVFDVKNLKYMYPYSIEIETINRCNNDCSFCPVNRKNDTRAFKKMSEKLYKSIIDQLADMNYDGYLSLFSNNEPLLDKRLIEFLEYAKRKLPSARLCLFTNGLLLTPETYEQLTLNLNYLVIDNYSDEMVLLPSVKEVYEKYKKQNTSCDVKIYIRKKRQILSSRGGEAPNRFTDTVYEGGCMMPFMQIVIRPDGKISKCCQDGLGITTIGDLRKEKITEAFKNCSREALCLELLNNGRKNISGCRNCDVFGHDNYMPPEWKPLIISQFIEIVGEHFIKKDNIVLIGHNRTRSMIERLLNNLGITISEKYDNCENVNIRQNDFYILENYEEPFLFKLDPGSKYAGKQWIVYEKISEYIVHDTSEPIERFAEIFASLLKNFKKIVFWGESGELEYITKNLDIKVDEAIELTSEPGTGTFNNDTVMITKNVCENRILEVQKKFGVEEFKIVRIEKIEEFFSSL